jgi:hypothetical protein
MVVENKYRKFMISQLPGGNNAGGPTDVNSDINHLSPLVASVQYDADGIYQKCRTNNTVGSVAGWVPSQSPVGINSGLQRQAKPIMYVIVKTGAVITSAAWHIGLTSYEPTTPDATQHEAKLWYDTDVHSDGLWRTVTDNDSGSPEIQTTSLAITASQRMEVKIDCRDTSKIDFYVNNTLISSHTSQLPTLTAQISSFAVVKNRAASERNILVGRMVKSFD